MNRVEKILFTINKQGKGIEIGPSHSPIASKADGYDVEIIDCMDKKALISYFEDHPVDISKIEEVDYVWEGEPYPELIKKTNHYDWIISSHSIEHTTNLIGFLNDCDEILKDNGVISLAIPDKRFCFDYFRPLSGIGKVIDSHLNQNVRHSFGTHVEFNLNCCELDGVGSWGVKSFSKASKDKFSFVNETVSALKIAKEADDTTQYTDAHEWCFTYSSFRLLIQDLYDLGYIKLKEFSSFPSSGNEFHITLGRDGVGTNMSRLELLLEIEKENSMFASKILNKNSWWKSIFKS